MYPGGHRLQGACYSLKVSQEVPSISGKRTPQSIGFSEVSVSYAVQSEALTAVLDAQKLFEPFAVEVPEDVMAAAKEKGNLLFTNLAEGRLISYVLDTNLSNSDREKRIRTQLAQNSSEGKRLGEILIHTRVLRQSSSLLLKNANVSAPSGAASSRG